MAGIRCIFVLVLLVLPAELAGAQARRRLPPPPQPAPGLVAHEWGVWKIRQGQAAHIEELAAESPAFVFRAPHLAQVQPPPPVPLPVPHPHPHPPVARKPVIFFYANRPTHVEVEVEFNGGEPWLYYPDARPVGSSTAIGGSGSLRFSGRVMPGALPTYQTVAPSHFWSDLRSVGADPFVSDAGNAERFVFYDGPVAFSPSFMIGWQGRGAMVSRASTENVLWLVEHGQFTETDLQSGNAQVVAQGASNLLRQRLMSELGRRGLNDREASSLLDTWRDDLFRSPFPTAIYFIPREAYDRMLPIRITPQPAQLVRVGLVIEDLRTALAPR